MRQIGTIADERQAKLFADYLLTMGITTRLDANPAGWPVWVHREERVDQARGELTAFLQNPDDPKYQGVGSSARALRKEAERIERLHRKNSIDLRNRWSAYRPAARCPLTYALIGLSIAITAWSWIAGDPRVDHALSVASARPVETTDDPGRDGDYVGVHQKRIQVRSNVWKDVRRGQVWRLVTPIFLHFGGWHLLFNMIWLYDIGGLIEMRRGSLRFGLFVLLAAMASNLGQYYYNYWPFFGGMSGVNYAFFGFLWMKGLYDPGSGLGLRRDTVTLMLLWLVFCMTGTFGDVANAAHFAGLFFGVIVGVVPHLLDQRSRP